QSDAAESAESADDADQVDQVDAVDLPAAAVAAPDDGSVPDGYPIKGNRNSMKYHEPGGRYYDVTIAELYFDTPESAEAAGYEAPAGAKQSDEEPNEEGNV